MIGRFADDSFPTAEPTPNRRAIERLLRNLLICLRHRQAFFPVRRSIDVVAERSSIPFAPQRRSLPSVGAGWWIIIDLLVILRSHLSKDMKREIKKAPFSRSRQHANLTWVWFHEDCNDVFSFYLFICRRLTFVFARCARPIREERERSSVRVSWCVVGHRRWIFHLSLTWSCVLVLPSRLFPHGLLIERRQKEWKTGSRR